MLERTDAITNEVLEPIRFVLAYPTVFHEPQLSRSCQTVRQKNTVSSTEQKGSFPYLQQPTFRPYIQPDESSLYKMPFRTMLPAPKQSPPVRFHYYVTQWSRVPLEKLTVHQLVKKSPSFYVNRRFITVFTRARHLSLS